MSASLLASFASFLITGIFTFFFVTININLYDDIKTALFFALLANAFYFFYMEALTEAKPAIKKRLKNKHVIQWGIRIVNQTILFSLWFLLEINLVLFSIGLVLLYCLFILWDIITDEYKNNKNLFKIDIIGAIYSLYFLIFTYIIITPESVQTGKVTGVIIQPDVLSSKHFWWSTSLSLYILIPIIGIFCTNLELFNKKYWIRARLS